MSECVKCPSCGKFIQNGDVCACDDAELTPPFVAGNPSDSEIAGVRE